MQRYIIWLGAFFKSTNASKTLIHHHIWMWIVNKENAKKYTCTNWCKRDIILQLLLQSYVTSIICFMGMHLQLTFLLVQLCNKNFNQKYTFVLAWGQGFQKPDIVMLGNTINKYNVNNSLNCILTELKLTVRNIQIETLLTACAINITQIKSSLCVQII